MIPGDWKEDQDGYALVFFCLPNSRQWRGLITGIIESLSFGWSWNEKTGRITDVQAIGREIFESMAICKLDNILYEIQRLNAILAGEKKVDIVDGLPITRYDYTKSGLIPTQRQLFSVDNMIYPDVSVADILQTGLIGRQLNLPIPFDGDGLADIVDEQIDTLHRRFVQADITLPGGVEKNITQTLETLLRLDKFTDLEFLTPNIVTHMETVIHDHLAIDNRPLLLRLVHRLQNLLGSEIPEDQAPQTIAEIMAMLVETLADLDASTTINLNNCNGACTGEADCGCDDCTESKLTIETVD